jgi:aspartyl-tRNA synthetase
MSALAWKRTHSCGALRPADVGGEVVLMGWAGRVRDLGGILFVDLRDREGATQIVVRPDAGEATLGSARSLGSEWVIAVRGRVAQREPGTINRSLPTGEIEVVASDLVVLSEAKTPPFLPEDEVSASEEVRLKYRYLDLRRPLMQRRLAIRSRLALAARRSLESQGFFEIETPFLTKSTPEGARDYLVPSRVHRGSFYALPQSPQLFKQLLMIAGLERYFQIARCFRDEDFRHDRQPEFTQIDLEMSFVSEEDVFQVVENLFAYMLSEALGIRIDTPFPRYRWTEVMNLYGSDKPDLRYASTVADVSEVFAGSGYAVFERELAEKGAVRALAAPGCARYSRKEIEGLEALAREQGALGLGWARWSATELASPLAKHVGEERLREAFRRAGGSTGDLLLLTAGPPLKASRVLGALRVHLAQREGWAQEDDWRFLWVTEFPLFEYDEGERRWASSHHPFTAPHPEDLDKIESDPAAVRSRAYDVCANGYELGSGSIRIHRSDLQARIFRALSLSEAEAQEKFGFFLEALQFGTPPHGGIALGFDRITMLAAGGKSLRDVIAFPKTTSAFDLMTGSPSPVNEEQLRLLGLEIQS